MGSARKKTEASKRNSLARSPSVMQRLEADASPPDAGQAARWTFLTNHSHVLVLLFENPSRVLRDVAAKVGITERAVQRIIADLEADGYLAREKIGRQNHYRIRTDRPLRHAIEAHRTIGDLLRLILRNS